MNDRSGDGTGNFEVKIRTKDASGDSEDGEDDELPCVIGESAGDCV